MKIHDTAFSLQELHVCEDRRTRIRQASSRSLIGSIFVSRTGILLLLCYCGFCCFESSKDTTQKNSASKKERMQASFSHDEAEIEAAAPVRTGRSFTKICLINDADTAGHLMFMNPEKPVTSSTSFTDLGTFVRIRLPPSPRDRRPGSPGSC